MTRLARVAALLVLALGACKEPPASGQAQQSASPSSQTFEEAMRITCDAPDQADLPPEKPGDLNRGLLVARWIDQRVTNKEVRQLMGAAAASDTAAGKLAALREGARKAGIQRCALAEMWQRMASGASAVPEPSSSAEAVTTPAVPSEPQTYDEAIALLCAAAADETERAQQVRDRITNADVIRLAGSLGDVPPGERAARLRSAAAATGVEACPLADQLAAANP